MPDWDWGHVPRVSGLPKTGPGDTYPRRGLGTRTRGTCPRLRLRLCLIGTGDMYLWYVSPDETDGFRLFLIR
jgi:hypothetical protein